MLLAAVVVPGTVAFAILCVCARSWFLSRRQTQGEEGGPRHRDLTGWGIDETEVQPRTAEEDPEHEPFAAARAAAARLINS